MISSNIHRRLRPRAEIKPRRSQENDYLQFFMIFLYLNYIFMPLIMWLFKTTYQRGISLPHWYPTQPCDLLGPMEYGRRRVSLFQTKTSRDSACFCWHSGIPTIRHEQSMPQTAPVQREEGNTWCRFDSDGQSGCKSSWPASGIRAAQLRPA